MNALLYLESRQILNHLRKIIRQPARLLVYVFIVAYFVFAAVVRARTPGALPRAFFPEPYASAIFFAYVALLGILAYGAASGLVSAFYSGADARFLTGSHIPERMLVMWLQLRRSASTMGRTIFTAVLYAVVFARAGALSGIAFSMIGAAFAASAIAVPMLKIRSKFGGAAAQSIAGAIAVCGLLPMIVLLTTLVSPTFAAPAHALERFGAGEALNALLAANTAALVALFLFASLLAVAAYWCGTDILPELYAASLKMSSYRTRARRGGAAFAYQYAYRASSGSAKPPPFGGPWTIAWKEWIAFTRSPSMQRVFAFGLLASAAGGTIFGSFVAGSRDPLMAWVAFGSVIAPLTVIFIAIGSAIGLANDLAKPLWWMGPDPLWMRLIAWIAGTSWRFALCLAVGIAAIAITARAPLLALAGLPLALCAVLHLRAVGLVLYALFPAAIDQRGPLALVRAMLTYALAAPPAVCAIVCAFILRSAALGIAAGIGVSLAESGLLVAAAAGLISGHGVAFARAEYA